MKDDHSVGLYGQRSDTRITDALPKFEQDLLEVSQTAGSLDTERRDIR